MDPKLFELASQMSAGANDIKWLTLVLIASVFIVALYLRQRIAGYAVRLGQIEAETSKIEAIKEQLAATTKVTEGIKSEISQKDWRALRTDRGRHAHGQNCMQLFQAVQQFLDEKAQAGQ